MYETFGMPKSSSKARMMKKLSSPQSYEKESGMAHLNVCVSKKMLDGRETVTFSISKCGAETQEFTSVESFAENIKSIASGLKAKL